MSKTKPSTTSKAKTDNKYKLSWLPKKTFELEFAVDSPTAKKTYDQVLKKVSQETEIKGFRKGKAPIKIVEQNVDKQKLYEEVLKQLLPSVYEAAVKQHNLKPIISPKIQALSLKEGEDWQFKASACEAPEIHLADYQKAVKGELAKEAIWTPDKGKPEKDDKKPTKTYDQKIKLVTKALLDNVKAEISDLLIEDEVNRMLSKFLDQVNSLGMTIDQYLSSKQINQQQLRLSYQKQAEETLKLEFILLAIIKDKKIKIDDSEVDKMIDAAPDEKIKKQLNTPLQRAYISSILAKRKALDYLANL